MLLSNRNLSLASLRHRYEIVPEASELELHPINHQRTRSALTPPQAQGSAPEYFDGVAPANDTPGPGTPESTSDTNTSRTLDRSAQKHTRNSLSMITEWVPPSLHWGFGSRPPTPPHDKSVKGNDPSGLVDGDRENGEAYRRGRKERRRKATIFVSRFKVLYKSDSRTISLSLFFCFHALCSPIVCGRLRNTWQRSCRDRSS